MYVDLTELSSSDEDVQNDPPLHEKSPSPVKERTPSPVKETTPQLKKELLLQ